MQSGEGKYPILIITPMAEDGDFDILVRLGPKRSDFHFICQVKGINWELPDRPLEPIGWHGKKDVWDTIINFAADHRLPGQREPAYVSRRRYSRARRGV